MSNSDSTEDLEHGLGATKWEASSAVLGTSAELLTKVKSGVDEGGKENYDTNQCL